MDLGRYVDDLQHRLVVAADAGGEEARQLAQRLTAPLDAAVRLVLLDALSAAAGEISADLAPGWVDVRLRGGEPEFVVAAGADVIAAGGAGQPSPPVPPEGSAVLASTDADGGTTRTTLRLPEHLKVHVEVAAAREGTSVNSWLVRAVAAALDQSTGRPVTRTGSAQRSTNRVTGWVR